MEKVLNVTEEYAAKMHLSMEQLLYYRQKRESFRSIPARMDLFTELDKDNFFKTIDEKSLFIGSLYKKVYGHLDFGLKSSMEDFVTHEEYEKFENLPAEKINAVNEFLHENLTKDEIKNLKSDFSCSYIYEKLRKANFKKIFED